GELGVVLLDGGLDGGIVGEEGLEDDAAGGIATTGSAGDLGDELEGTLSGAEIGEGESGVAGDDADEGDIGIIQTLGDHLGAEEDFDFAATEAAEEGFVIAGAAHGVGVDTGI